MRIFPNPSTDIIHIKASKSIYSIQIFSSLGTMIYEGKPIDNKIDIHHLDDGFHFLKVNFEDGSSGIERFLKF